MCNNFKYAFFQALETTVNTHVIFSAVQKSRDFANKDITYSETVANIGNGMNPDTGVFTTPVSGIYSFSFQHTQNLE